jgi:hypothetical protein
MCAQRQAKLVFFSLKRIKSVYRLLSPCGERSAVEVASVVIMIIIVIVWRQECNGPGATFIIVWCSSA